MLTCTWGMARSLGLAGPALAAVSLAAVLKLRCEGARSSLRCVTMSEIACMQQLLVCRHPETVQKQP